MSGAGFLFREEALVEGVTGASRGRLWRVIVDTTDHDFRVALDAFFEGPSLVLRRFQLNIICRLEFLLLLLVVLQVVELEEPHDAEPDLSLGPVRQKLLLYEGILGWAVFDHRLDELLLLAWAPVLALLHVEVLDVELAVFIADITCAKIFAHLNDVLLLLLCHIVVARLPNLTLDVHRRRLSRLLVHLQL